MAGRSSPTSPDDQSGNELTRRRCGPAKPHLFSPIPEQQQRTEEDAAADAGQDRQQAKHRRRFAIASAIGGRERVASPRRHARSTRVPGGVIAARKSHENLVDIARQSFFFPSASNGDRPQCTGLKR